MPGIEAKALPGWFEGNLCLLWLEENGVELAGSVSDTNGGGRHGCIVCTGLSVARYRYLRPNGCFDARAVKW